MQTIATEELLTRLQTLEAENRKMKRWATVFLIVIGSVIFMAQVSKNRALDADSLTIRDAAGNVRIQIATLEDRTPSLKMWGGDNNAKWVDLHSGPKGSSLLFVGTGATLLTDVDGPALTLADTSGTTTVDGGSVQTSDHDKFRATLGRVSTVNVKTGGTTQSSAAALTMFGKDDKVIWQAP